MDKTIGYELIVKNVRGFNDARAWMHRLIGVGIVKCGQCDSPATHIFFQDQAEFYIRCDAHPETGPQWTGSTRWNPSAFSINVIKEKARAWFETLSAEDRQQLRVRKYDATDYYALMDDDYYKTKIRHYLVGSATEYGYQVYVDIYPLTNGEYAYCLHKDWHYEHGGSGYADAIKGAWSTEAEALEAARADAKVPS